MWNWIKLTDASFASLRDAKVPEAVLEKLTHLKDKDLSRKDLAKEMSKVLDTIEFEMYQEHILTHAVKLEGNARRLKRINRCLVILPVFFIIDVIACLVLAKFLILPKIVPLMMVALGMMAGFLGLVLGATRNQILQKIRPGSDEDYSEEFSLGHHPAKFKPVLLLPFSLRTRILIYLGALAVEFVLIRTGVLNGLFAFFVGFATLIFLPFLLFVKQLRYDPNAPIEPDWQPQTKKDYYVPNIRTRAFWIPFLLWLSFSSVVLGQMIYQVIACLGCILELLGPIVLGIMWKRNCRPTHRPAVGPPHNMDS